MVETRKEQGDPPKPKRPDKPKQLRLNFPEETIIPIPPGRSDKASKDRVMKAYIDSIERWIYLMYEHCKHNNLKFKYYFGDLLTEEEINTIKHYVNNTDSRIKRRALTSLRKKIRDNFHDIGYIIDNLKLRHGNIPGVPPPPRFKLRTRIRLEHVAKLQRILRDIPPNIEEWPAELSVPMYPESHIELWQQLLGIILHQLPGDVLASRLHNGITYEQGQKTFQIPREAAKIFRPNPIKILPHDLNSTNPDESFQQHFSKPQDFINNELINSFAINIGDAKIKNMFLELISAFKSRLSDSDSDSGIDQLVDRVLTNEEYFQKHVLQPILHMAEHLIEILKKLSQGDIQFNRNNIPMMFYEQPVQVRLPIHPKSPDLKGRVIIYPLITLVFDLCYINKKGQVIIFDWKSSPSGIPPNNSLKMLVYCLTAIKLKQYFPWPKKWGPPGEMRPIIFSDPDLLDPLTPPFGLKVKLGKPTVDEQRILEELRTEIEFWAIDLSQSGQIHVFNPETIYNQENLARLREIIEILAYLYPDILNHCSLSNIEP